jgi:hypothetical protein
MASPVVSATATMNLKPIITLQHNVKLARSKATVALCRGAFKIALFVRAKLHKRAFSTSGC